MRPTGKLIGPRLLTGGLVCLGLAARAAAGSLTLTTVFDNQSPVDSELTYVGTQQVVAGNNGVVATYSFFNDGGYSAITLNQTSGNANTQIIARDDALGGTGPRLNDYNGHGDSFQFFSELALTQAGQTKVTFIAADYSNNMGIYQGVLAGNTLVPVTVQDEFTYSLKTEDDQNNAQLVDIHQQVNDAGQVVYGIRSNTDNHQAIGLSGNVLLNENDPDTGNLKAFNFVADSSPSYKRIAIAQDGSVVFRATNSANAIGIYRSTDFNHPIVNVSSSAIVLGASNNNVLYTDVSGINGENTDLKLTGQALPIISYATSDHFAHNAVMTQGERVAFFTPDNPIDHSIKDGTVGYFRAGYNAGVAKIIATDHDTNPLDVLHDADGHDYTIDTVSSVDVLRNSVPMVNDKGTVVFDAYLATEDSTTVKALIAWQESSGKMQIVVKAADANGNFGDQYNGQNITDIVVDSSTDVAGDVTKDGLSDDNWLAFGISYGDFDNPNFAVVETFIPEPTSAGALLAIGGAAMLRRRRR